MRTIALRFSDGFAPPDGTISQHKKIIDQIGHAWYGKLGAPISKDVKNKILNTERPRILLIHSGSVDRYWAYIKDVVWEKPAQNEYPNYYADKADKMNTWFCLSEITRAPKDILARCRVASSGTVLSEASRSSMSPYFVIDAPDED